MLKQTFVTKKRTGKTRVGAKREGLTLNGVYAQIAVNMFIQGTKKYSIYIVCGNNYVYTGYFVLNETIKNIVFLNNIAML